MTVRWLAGAVTGEGPTTNTNTDHFHHLRVIKVIDDVFQDVSVRHKSQRSKYDDNGNFLSDVWQRRHNPLTNGTLFHSLGKGSMAQSITAI